MSFITEVKRIGLKVVEAALSSVTGSGAPAASAPVATIAGQAITFGQLATAAQALHGSGIGGELAQLVADIAAGHGSAAVDDALDVTQQVAKILAPIIPVAGEIAIAARVLEIGYDVGHALYVAHPEAFAPAPRGGPPIAEADWSHGWPKPQPVDNPSGAIGG